MAQGARFFTPKLEWPTGVAGNAFSVGDWARTVDAVEAQGWVLEQWTVVPEGKAHSAFPVFRRR